MKMYVMVRKELSQSQKAVQAAHAVAEFMYKHSNLDSVKDWMANHKTMVIIESSEFKMEELKHRFT